MQKINLDYIKKQRLDLNLSLLEVAQGLGFKNASTYLKYENGDYSFKADMLPILANILKCQIENFFANEIAEIEISEDIE